MFNLQSERQEVGAKSDKLVLRTMCGDIKQFGNAIINPLPGTRKREDSCQELHKERLWWLMSICILLGITWNIVTQPIGEYEWPCERTIY